MDREPGSSVSTESGYGLGDREIEVRSPAAAKGFFLQPVSRPSEVHPASYQMGTGDPFSGAKARPGHDVDRSPPSSADVKNE
jgi:hypothetical protein